jgi:virulence factor Mce-like protein
VGGRRTSIVANPVLVGAVTTLVVVVAVFLAYNANSGLPFVPTRALNVQIDNGAELVKGNDVRAGGYRVGIVDEMVPTRLPNGRVGALLKLKLDKKLGEVPVDSTVVIRPRSALGLKYVELHRGRSSRTIPDGGTLPVSQASVPVELDEFYNMFDERTRRASRLALKGFGNAFVGRGEDLNRTIADAPRFFRGLTNVMANLSDPRTDLRSFFKELGDTVRVIAPISRINAQQFSDMATTFEAFSRDPEALKATITRNVPNLEVGTRSLRVQRPFLAETAAFSHDLRFAAADLKDALPPLNSALKAGIPVTQRSIQMNKDLQGALDALRGLAEAPTTNGAIRGLIATVETLQPQLRFLGPQVTVCNAWTTFWTFNAEHFSAPDVTGGSERALLNNANGDPDSITSMGANEFVHGVPADNPIQHSQNGGVPQFLHDNQIGGVAIDSQGRAACYNGQRGYAYSRNYYRPADGYEAYARANVDAEVVDDAYPGGPHFKTYDRQGGHGLFATRVPPGETFTARPGGRGAQLPPPPRQPGRPSGR